MDSKVKQTAIFFMTVMVLMILGVVLYSNWDVIEKKYFSDGTSVQAVAAENETAQQENGTGIKRENGQVGDDLTAFMEDETFFNSKSTLDKYKPSNAANKLSIIVTSVEQDLRVQVVNNDGKPVTGKSFYIMYFIIII